MAEANQEFGLSAEIYERETGMCRKLNGKNGGRCNWGECEKCGVIPLLTKLHTGELLESAEEIARARGEIFRS